jgi:hypothetical protein
MGVNLEEFTHFLGTINNDDTLYHDTAFSGGTGNDAAHWKMVQSMLIQSDWAKRYSGRAISVIAMFDPDYEGDPWQAERDVRAQLHPFNAHSHRRRAASVRTASTAHHKANAHRTKRS